MKELTQSPTLKKVDTIDMTMDFPTAIKMVTQGKKIHKLEWEDREYYGFLNSDILSLHKPDGKNYQWVLNDGDLNGNDWVMV